MSEKPIDIVQIDFPIWIFKNSGYSFPHFIKDRASFQFLEIHEVEDNLRFFVSKKRYEFSEKKLKKFGMDYKDISLFWVVAELLCNKVYDVCFGKEHFQSPLTKSINQLKESLRLSKKLKEGSDEISLEIHDRYKHSALKRLNFRMAELSPETIECLQKDSVTKDEELVAHLQHNEFSLAKIKKVGREIRLANAWPLFLILKNNINLRHDSHYKIILGYIFYINNLGSFKPSKENPDYHLTLRKSFESYDDVIDIQSQYKKLPRLYDYELRLRDNIDQLLKSSEKYHSSS